MTTLLIVLTKYVVLRMLSYSLITGHWYTLGILLKHILLNLPETNFIFIFLHLFSYFRFSFLDLLCKVDLLLGKSYSDWGHVSDAVAVYDQLISKHPDDFRGYLAKVWFLLLFHFLVVQLSNLVRKDPWSYQFTISITGFRRKIKFHFFSQN